MRNVGAIILAAGGASRFGQIKQLLLFQGESLVRRAVRNADKAGCRPVVVVVGPAGEKIRSELQGTPAIVVENPKWRRGLGTSIRRGLQSILESDGDLENVVLLVCDQPFADATIIQSLIRKQVSSGKSIVASAYDGTVGVPALFNRVCFEDLGGLPDELGAKRIITSHLDQLAEISFEKGGIDIDTADDFERLNRPLA